MYEASKGGKGCLNGRNAGKDRRGKEGMGRHRAEGKCTLEFKQTTPVSHAMLGTARKYRVCFLQEEEDCVGAECAPVCAFILPDFRSSLTTPPPFSFGSLLGTGFWPQHQSGSEAYWALAFSHDSLPSFVCEQPPPHPTPLGMGLSMPLLACVVKQAQQH